MNLYAESAQAAQDVLRVLQYRKREITQGLDECSRKHLDTCMARICDLTGDELLEIILRNSLPLSKALAS